MCDVCSKDEVFGVCASRCGPVSFGYCEECLTKGREPYGVLVAYLSGAVSKGEDLKPEHGQLHQGYYTIIDASLELAGKTHEQFYADIDKAIEDEKAWYARLMMGED